ncbi:hypothetical protein [Bradyrhizobium sp. SZCCHNR1015]|uniref:hypothetical protein n=1 Tax=Bradyrhizobium sp. SZCCHNR1015 TaxID=3057338 RepID=UPI002916985A|nr:hypothetical protein [Bradyrhizobium sp. SZCCHNR1015]
MTQSAGRGLHPELENSVFTQTIAAAGNTEIPAYLTLIKLGYEIDRRYESDGELWSATKGTLQLVAESPLQLLGLALMYMERGADWQADDDEIDAFLKRFYP